MELIENEYCELKSILTKDIKKEDTGKNTYYVLK